MSKAEKTRQYIIEKTAAVFNTKGYAGTSINDLTEATGLTKGSIYGNFENKDEVALAAFDHNLGLVMGGIGRYQDKYESALGKLKAYIEFYRSPQRNEQLRAGCPIVNTATEADDTHPFLKDKVQKALGSWRKSIEKLTSQAIKAKELSADLDAYDFSIYMLTLLEGGIMLSKATGDLRYINQAVNEVEKRILENEL